MLEHRQRKLRHRFDVGQSGTDGRHPGYGHGSELRGVEGIADLRPPAGETGLEPARALRRGAVGERIGHHIALRLLLQSVVAHGLGRVDGLFHIARLQHLALVLRVIGPDPGVAIGLQLQPHQQGVGASGAAALHGVAHLALHAQQVLHMVADFMRDHIRLGEVALRAKALLQLPEKLDIEIQLLVRRAVERPGGCLRVAAGRLHRAGKQHQLGIDILPPRLLEQRAPGVFGIGQHHGEKLLVLLILGGQRGRGLLCGLLRLLLRHLIEHHTRGDPEIQRHQRQHDGANAAAHKPAPPAGPRPGSPLIFDVVTASAIFPEHDAPPLQGNAGPPQVSLTPMGGGSASRPRGHSNGANYAVSTNPPGRMAPTSSHGLWHGLGVWRRGARRHLPPLAHQRLPLRQHLRQIALLDVAVAADAVGQTGDLRGELQALGRAVGVEAAQQFGDRFAVLTDQGALLLALCRMAEGVERGAAQHLERREQPESHAHPRAELALDQLALGIALAPQRRREVVMALEMAFELLLQLFGKRRVGLQPGDFVLVFVGHELEQMARHGLRQRSGLERRFGGAHLRNEVGVLPGVGSILVAGEELHPALNDFVQAGTLDQLNDLLCSTQRGDALRIVRRMAAPLERRLVLLDLHRVELDGAHQRGMAQRHPALLPGEAQQHGVGVNGVAQQLLGGAHTVEPRHMVGASSLFNGLVAGSVGKLPIGVVNEGRGGRAVGVERDVGAAFAHARQGFAVGGDDRVAAENQLGLGRADAGGDDLLRVIRDQHMAPGRAAFLRQPGGVLRDHALALDMRGHAEQLADGDNAGAADTGDDDAVAAAARHIVAHRVGHLGLRQFGHGRQIGSRLRLGFAQRAAFHRDEAGAKALEAGKVFVAAALVDGALAAEFGFQRLDRQAVALIGAVAATFANQRIDDHAPRRIDHQPAFAAAALFGGAGLVVDDDGDASLFAQLALNGIEIVAVAHRRPAGQADGVVVLLRFVGDHHDAAHAFCLELAADLRYGQASLHRLPARHRHGVVEQNLVGGIHPGGDGLANGEQPRVVIGAVAQIDEHMLVGGERRLADPSHALAAHLAEGLRGTVHPHHHVVAADTGHAARAFGHAGRGVVRAARAEPGRTLGTGARRLQGALARVDHRQPFADAALHIHPGVAQDAQPLQPRGNGPGDDRRIEVGLGGQQPVAAGIGLAPFAAGAVSRDFVELADDVGPHVFAPVVELFLELILDDLALFFHHQNLLQPGGEFAGELRLERPDHGDLVQADAELRAGVSIQPEIVQGLTGIVIGLARGHDAQPRVRAVDDGVVQAIGADIGQRRVPLHIHQPCLLSQRRVGDADVHAVRRQGKVFGQQDAHAVGVHIDRGRRLHDFLDGLHARPDAGIAAQGKGVHAQIENVLHRGGKEHRQPARLEDMVALVRERR